MVNRMEIQYGALQSPKPGSTAAQCEDAFAYSDSNTMSIAAVCDGAGTAFESRLWARLLADAFVTAPPPEWTGAAVLDWADTVARYWQKEIPWQHLNPFEEEKARQGSAATLVGMQFAVPPPHATTGTWQCLALGDSCLFQMRQGQPVAALPLQRSADFNAHPPLLSTQRSITEQYIGKLVTYEGIWQTGDTFLLMTDAIAAWFLREGEQGTEPWEFLAALDERRFAQFVHETQTRRLMRTDDVTVFMIGMGAPLSTRRVPLPVESAARPGMPPVPLPPVQPERVLAGQRQGDPGPDDSRLSTAQQGLPPQRGQPLPGGQTADTGRGGGRKLIRSRAALIAAACVVLAAVVALVLASTGGPPPSSTSAKTAGTQFAKALATYPYQGRPAKPGETPYAAYLSALRHSVAGQNTAIVYRLVGHRLAPAASLRSQATVGSVTAAQSTQSRAILYIVVHQVITAPHTVPATTRRTLLVYLVMTRRPGQNWLVKTGQTSLIAPIAQGGGVLSPVTSPSRPHPPAPPPPAVKKSVTVTGGNQ
jgi:hypothetical protein